MKHRALFQFIVSLCRGIMHISETLHCQVVFAVGGLMVYV